ncbi:MAG: RsmD family RNA methyltransferase, partial [bacterium]|nr:RsmD family RNA methyltransferase [bacterium]
MRIISGKYKGRKLKGYNVVGTRPTMDKVKESVINIIRTNIDKSICLDLFAGSGSIGFELLSNGASKCYLVDKSKVMINIIKENIYNLSIDNAFVLHGDYYKYLLYFKDMNYKFD